MAWLVEIGGGGSEGWMGGVELAGGVSRVWLWDE